MQKFRKKKIQLKKAKILQNKRKLCEKHENFEKKYSIFN